MNIMLIFCVLLLSFSVLIPDLHPTLSCKAPAQSFTTSITSSTAIHILYNPYFRNFPLLFHVSATTYMVPYHRTIDWLWLTYSVPSTQRNTKNLPTNPLHIPHSPTIPQPLAPKQTTYHPLNASWVFYLHRV